MSSLQDTFSPNGICFGCGPKNEKGLRIKSFAKGESEATAEFLPEKHHEAFPGMVNGGILGSLLDCHSNWTAAHALMKANHQATPPCTVTADFHVKLKAPTPSGQKIFLQAKAVDVQNDRAKIEAELYTINVDGSKKLTATCVGTFVAVKEGHLAYHRWG